jgi:hypothetical protein
MQDNYQKPGETATADAAKPDEAKPDEAKPDEAKPDETKPEETKPGEKFVDVPAIAQPKCGETFLGAPDTKECPTPDCPFAAELDVSANALNECHFKCVVGSACGTEGSNTARTIPDEKEGICRQCNVEGCAKCQAGKPGEDLEFCEKCMPGYYKVDANGDGLAEECRCWTIWIFVFLCGVAALAAIAALAWYVELANRPTVNEEGLQYALECRSRSRVRQPMNTVPSDNPDDGIGPRLLYPINTNLCTTNVAGPGNILFFRFQAATLIWACTLLAVWILMCVCIDTVVLTVGLGEPESPAQLCYAIKNGRRLQLHFVWVKVYWCVFAYIFSFLGAIYYAINSQSLFHQLDNDHTTMADYVALCRSLPVTKGDQNVEEKIKEAIEKETSQKVVGVSVCWNFHGNIREVKEALEEDVGSLEHAKAINSSYKAAPAVTDTPGIAPSAEEEPGCLQGYMDIINNSTLQKWHCHFTDEEEAKPKSEEEKKNEIVEMLKGMENTEFAFAVFETEDGRDKALEAVKGRPIPLNDGGFFLEYEDHEPESCCWEDFSVDEAQIFKRVSQAVLWMVLSLFGWTFLLYAPYAHYMGSFTHKQGDEAGPISEGIFVGLVVGAQIGLFVVASMGAHHSGFCYEDDRVKTYMVLYNSALIVNLILDLCLTTGLAYKEMCGQGTRTADGRLLSEIEGLQAILESFPMQHQIGLGLFKYCFPATFLVPFAAEPFAAQIGPYLVGINLVRSNKKMQGENAEKALELSEAEQGRYADVMFNAILIACVPFLAPGYMLKTFAALIFSHIYIYCYDHWRVLRCCTRFWFAGGVVNEFAQKIFAVPIAIIACSALFKWNQMKGAAVSSALAAGPMKGATLWWAMAGVFFGHCFLHWMILTYAVPLMCVPESKNAEEPYSKCAESIPSTWFSCNPVHCLRSKYIMKHDPPQTFLVIGKEHLQKKNPAIGAHFEAEETKVEGTLGL